MYKFVFIFAQPWREGIKKNVRIEDAVCIWPMLLGNRCDFVPKLCTFFEKKQADKKLEIVPKDTWDVLWDFNKECRGKLANAPENDLSWPTLIEEFMIGQGIWKEETY